MPLLDGNPARSALVIGRRLEAGAFQGPSAARRRCATMWQSVALAVTKATFVDWLLLFFGVLLVLYILGTWNYDYFQKRGIPSTKPTVPFAGDLITAFLRIRPFVDVIKDLYNRGQGHDVFGMFEFTVPTFIIRDPEILKVVTVKDFDNFMNHRNFETEGVDRIFSNNLINLKDQPWRDMRATLSPAFTTSKIKGLFPLVRECTGQMAQNLRQKYNNSEEGSRKEPMPTDMKDLFGRLATDIIATAAFGVSCDSQKEPQNEFYHMGKLLTKFTTLQAFKFLGFIFSPKLMGMLGLRVLNRTATDFFDALVHETIRRRQKEGIFRPDMVQLLMQAREGQLKADKEDAGETEDVGAKTTKLEDEDISAQAVIFFFAGFETISTALASTTHALAHNEETQKRLQAEVDEVMEETDGRPTYEAVQKMKYLDAVVNEALRMHPPAIATDRKCKNDSVLPTKSGPITVRKGHTIQIPIFGIHHDPQYWDEPEAFKPERFSDENKHKIKPFTYMPFGLGPRICIGQRFALVEVKLTLVHLLASFDLRPCAKTPDPLQYEPGFNVMARGGYWCSLLPRGV